jgi:hypothetical protein
MRRKRKLGANGILEELRLRCPRLGGEVPLAYCLQEGGDLPCRRIVICWQPYFPVEACLKARLSRQQWEDCFDSRPKEKIATLVELIEEAKRGGDDNAR